jgi:glycosyltransferase involved in cell wall biosynthesis
MNHKCGVLIPFGSELSENELGVKPKKILLTFTHAAKFNIRFPSTIFNSALNKFFVTSSNKDSQIYKALIKLILNTLILNFTFLYILIYRKKFTHLLFPTICPISQALIYKIERMKLNITICVRFTNTSENRGFLSELFPSKEFIIKAKEFKYINFRVGFETKKYQQFMNFENAFHTPFPMQYLESTGSVNSNKLIISFLGYPKAIKGIDVVPEVIKRVYPKRKDMSWLVQAKDAIDSTNLEIFDTSIEVHLGRIESKLMEDLVRKSTLLCLPYSIEKYLLNASAMAYEAADFLKPILTFAGTAFADETLEHGIGIVVENLEEMIHTLIRFDLSSIPQFQENIRRYNQYRNDANCRFLEL